MKAIVTVELSISKDHASQVVMDTAGFANGLTEVVRRHAAAHGFRLNEVGPNGEAPAHTMHVEVRWP